MRNLLDVKEKLPFDANGATYRQISLFDDQTFHESAWQKVCEG